MNLLRNSTYERRYMYVCIWGWWAEEVKSKSKCTNQIAVLFVAVWMPQKNVFYFHCKHVHSGVLKREMRVWLISSYSSRFVLILNFKYVSRFGVNTFFEYLPDPISIDISQIPFTFLKKGGKLLQLNWIARSNLDSLRIKKYIISNQNGVPLKQKFQKFF